MSGGEDGTQSYCKAVPKPSQASNKVPVPRCKTEPCACFSSLVWVDGELGGTQVASVESSAHSSLASNHWGSIFVHWKIYLVDTGDPSSYQVQTHLWYLCSVVSGVLILNSVATGSVAIPESWRWICEIKKGREKGEGLRIVSRILCLWNLLEKNTIDINLFLPTFHLNIFKHIEKGKKF